MEVNGNLLYRKRMKIRSENPGRGSARKPNRGTQDWLAEQANVSLRSVQKLEKGEASERVLKAVCKALGEENWEQYKVNFGQEYVLCSVEKHIDFRPLKSPRMHPEEFSSSVMMMTIDPLTLCAEAGHFDTYELKNVKATLSGLKEKITFSWYAQVSLTEESNNWLGKIREVEHLKLQANNKSLNIPIMFRQEGIRISWKNFVEMVEGSKNSNISIKAELVFTNFTKTVDFVLCMHCLKRLFETGREVRKSEWPYRVQLTVISPTE